MAAGGLVAPGALSPDFCRILGVGVCRASSVLAFWWLSPLQTTSWQRRKGKRCIALID